MHATRFAREGQGARIHSDEALRSRRITLLAKGLWRELWMLSPGQSSTIECRKDVDLEMVLQAIQEFSIVHTEAEVKVQRIGIKELFALQVIRPIKKYQPS